MSENNPFRLYISHLWRADDDYLRVLDYLSDVAAFFYVNLSQPDAHPAQSSREAVQAEYKRQMEQAEVVMVLAAHYVADVTATQYQLDLAKALKKPIVAVEPFGADSIVKAIKDKADEVVPWYNRSMVDAIRHHGRGDLTSRYEVIDFP